MAEKRCTVIRGGVASGGWLTGDRCTVIGDKVVRKLAEVVL